MRLSEFFCGSAVMVIEVLETAEALDPERGGNLAGYAFLGVGLGEAYLTQAEESEGRARQGWLKKAGVVFRKTLKAAKRNRQTLVSAMRYQGRYEWLRGKREAAQNWWLRALALAKESGMVYDEGMTHLEIGRRLGDRQHLQQAESILEAIGAEFDLAKTREELANLPVS